MELTARQKSLTRQALLILRNMNMKRYIDHEHMEAYHEIEEITEILVALYKCVTVKVVLE